MGSGQSVDMSNRDIVIIGGGYGGSYLAHKLVTQTNAKVTLVEPKDGLFHTIGTPRAAVDAGFTFKLFPPYNEKLEKSHIKTKATCIDAKNKTVSLENGNTINYSELIIATGASSPFPGKLGIDNPSLTNEEISIKYANFREQLRSSTKVVIVGGGAVGVETAGEITTDFPEKEVTIIHSREILASDKSKPAFQKALKNALRKKKVEMLLGERVSNLDELTLNKCQQQVVKTQSGKEISCDLVIPCTGTVLNNQFFKESLVDAVNEVGALRVSDLLAVKGHENIYAIGDINDIPEEKLAYTAKLQVDALYLTLQGKPKPYKPGEFAMLVPLGRNGGVTQFNGLIFGDFLSKNLKAKDMFASQMWKDLGAKLPKQSDRRPSSAV